MWARFPVHAYFRNTLGPLRLLDTDVCVISKDLFAECFAEL